MGCSSSKFNLSENEVNMLITYLPALSLVATIATYYILPKLNGDKLELFKNSCIFIIYLGIIQYIYLKKILKEKCGEKGIHKDNNILHLQILALNFVSVIIGLLIFVVLSFLAFDILKLNNYKKYVLILLYVFIYYGLKSGNMLSLFMSPALCACNE